MLFQFLGYAIFMGVLGGFIVLSAEMGLGPRGFPLRGIPAYTLREVDVFLMIRRKKLTIFTDAKDTTTVLELKKIIEGILKIPPANQQLYNKDETIMEDSHLLQDYGLNSATAKAQSPATVGLAVRDENGTFEPLELVPYSNPPDLPDVMKSQEANGQDQSS